MMKNSTSCEKFLVKTENNFSFLFYLKANEKIGLGHLYRCRALILAFQGLGQKNIAVSCSNLTLVKKVFSDKDIHIVNCQDRKSLPVYDMIITDFPEISFKQQAELKKHCHILVGIDDSPSGKNVFDILICPTFISTKVDTKEIWQGRDHILLHPEFSKINILKEPCSKVVNLLVCFGGSDPNNFTFRILSLLQAHFPELQLTIVTGAGYKHSAKLHKKQKGDKDKRIRFLNNIHCLAEEFLRADVALVSGGTLMFEACSLGVPSVIICQNIQQNNEAEIFNKTGAVLNLGIGTDVADADLILAVKKICTDKTMRQRISFNARKSISNQGCKHTAYKLLQTAKGAVS